MVIISMILHLMTLLEPTEISRKEGRRKLEELLNMVRSRTSSFHLFFQNFQVQCWIVEIKWNESKLKIRIWDWQFLIVMFLLKFVKTGMTMLVAFSYGFPFVIFVVQKGEMRFWATSVDGPGFLFLPGIYQIAYQHTIVDHRNY